MYSVSEKEIDIEERIVTLRVQARFPLSDCMIANLVISLEARKKPFGRPVG
jgi:hypothetical protein